MPISYSPVVLMRSIKNWISPCLFIDSQRLSFPCPSWFWKREIYLSIEEIFICSLGCRKMQATYLCYIWLIEILSCNPTVDQQLIQGSWTCFVIPGFLHPLWLVVLLPEHQVSGISFSYKHEVLSAVGGEGMYILFENLSMRTEWVVNSMHSY